MEREQIVFVGTSDLSAHFRGKSFPAAELSSRLQRGVGLAPTNMFLSAFGPDPDDDVRHHRRGVSDSRRLHPRVRSLRRRRRRVLLSRRHQDTGRCALGFLSAPDPAPRAASGCEHETGLRLLASFEQEFVYQRRCRAPTQPYELDAYRRQGCFGESAAGGHAPGGRDPGFVPVGVRHRDNSKSPPHRRSGCAPPMMPSSRARSPRRSRSGCGQRVSLAPIPEPDGTGNGTHIHWSFRDRRRPAGAVRRQQPLAAVAAGQPIHRRDRASPAGAVRADRASVPSYYRLRPNRWAPDASRCGARWTAARRCASARSGGDDPVQRARQFNVEFRVADATASPYLALAMLVQAGLDGVRHRGKSSPAAAASAAGRAWARRWNASKPARAAAEWLGTGLLAAYLQFKRAEIQRASSNSDETEICRRYGEVY